MNPHLYEMTCWEINGKWHVNDIKNLAGKSGKWYTPMRILNASIDEYINLLLSYKAINLHYYKETDYLGFCFATEMQAKRFCAYINTIAKKRKYYCY